MSVINHKCIHGTRRPIVDPANASWRDWWGRSICIVVVLLKIANILDTVAETRQSFSKNLIVKLTRIERNSKNLGRFEILLVR